MINPTTKPTTWYGHEYAKQFDAHMLGPKLESAIAQWDRRQRNPHAGAIALQRLDQALTEVRDGKSLARALYDNFNDRLLTALEKAAGLPVTFGGGAHDRGRPA
jgi:hypothetical protein